MTNSKIGKQYPRETRYVQVSYPDGTGPCGKICSCNEYCKDSGLSFELMKFGKTNHGAKVVPASELGKAGSGESLQV